MDDYYIDYRVNKQITYYPTMPNRKKFEEYDSHGRIQRIYYKKGNLLDGPYEEYYENGNVKRTCSFYENELDVGFYKEYYKNGNLKLKCFMLEGGYLHDTYQVFYENGIKAHEFSIHEGEYCMPEKVWYENGSLWKEIDYEMGSYQEWNEDGKLIRTFYFEPIKEIKDNFEDSHRKTGLYTEFYENGKMKKRCEYRNHEIVGVYETWDEDGNYVEKYEISDVEKRMNEWILFAGQFLKM